MKLCKICRHTYHDSRLHCPTCGAFQVGSQNYDIGNLRQLVVAYGAQRQNYARVVRLDVRDCDGKE